jgi:hypothetical protein
MEAETAVLSADRSFFSFLMAAGVAVLDMAPFGASAKLPQPVHARVCAPARIVAFVIALV